jgi:hypothetical protein
MIRKRSALHSPFPFRAARSEDPKSLTTVEKNPDLATVEKFMRALPDRTNLKCRPIVASWGFLGGGLFAPAPLSNSALADRAVNWRRPLLSRKLSSHCAYGARLTAMFSICCHAPCFLHLSQPLLRRQPNCQVSGQAAGRHPLTWLSKGLLTKARPQCQPAQRPTPSCQPTGRRAPTMSRHLLVQPVTSCCESKAAHPPDFRAHGQSKTPSRHGWRTATRSHSEHGRQTPHCRW